MRRLLSRLLWPFLGAALVGGVLTVACGAENQQAPRAVEQSITHCRGIDQLMPNFVRAINSGKTNNLKKVIEEHLLVPTRAGLSPPLNDVLRSIFATLTRAAQRPPEVGAVDGGYCSPDPVAARCSADGGLISDGGVTGIPLAQANKVCEARRALSLLMHQAPDCGQPVGIRAVQVAKPQLATLLNYINGTGRGADAYATCTGQQTACTASFEVRGKCASKSNGVMCEVGAPWGGGVYPTCTGQTAGSDCRAQLSRSGSCVEGASGRQCEVDHFEIAGAFSAMSSQTNVCQLSNGLDLVIAFADYASTPDGTDFANHLGELMSKPGFADALDPSSLSEDGTIAIVKVLESAIAATDAQALQNAFDMLPLSNGADGGSNLRADFQPLVNDLKKLLSRPALMGPIKTALVCFNQADSNYDIVRMIHRLAIRDKLPELGLTRLGALLQAFRAADTRGSLLYVVRALAVAIKSDQQAVSATATVLKLLLSNSAPDGGTSDGGLSNAALALPTISEMVGNGLIEEIICAADTLLFGCAGSSQPACGPY